MLPKPIIQILNLEDKRKKMKNMFVFHSVAKNQLTEVKGGLGRGGRNQEEGLEPRHSHSPEKVPDPHSPPLPREGPTELTAMVLPPPPPPHHVFLMAVL